MEKKIAITHHTLASLGGGERVGVSLIEALNKADVVPDVYTTSPIKLSYLQQYYGKEIKCHIKSILPITMATFGIYQRLLPSFKSFSLTGYDVVINTTGIYTPLFLKSFIKRYLLYIYNPLVPLQFTAVKENLKYERSLFWKLYFQPYQGLVKRSIRKLADTEILSVSNFTKWRVWKYWNKQSKTVYPPVDIGNFSSTFDNNNREGVISIARFTPEKNHLLQLEIAKKLPSLTFRICGSAKTPYYWRWYQHIKTKAEELNANNVEFYPNIPFKSLVTLIGESRFFLHTMFYEDFGLTTAEAIAGGCLPIVHNSGGQKEVVPIKELRFNNVDEAVSIMVNLSRQDECAYKESLYNHIQQFSEDVFQQKMLEVMKI